MHGFWPSMQNLQGLASSHLLLSCLQLSHRNFTSLGPRPTWIHSSDLATQRAHGRWSSHYSIQNPIKPRQTSGSAFLTFLLSLRQFVQASFARSVPLARGVF